ncbi:MAG: hypothetical protein HZB09_00855 [Candidatus Yonathbacteria bacterium]|nr:hypothetical protein [Candidatus Yonathbacteria bacterium]
MRTPNIKKIFKGIIQRQDKDKFKTEMTPHRDWRILVIAFAVFVIGVGVASFYIFVQIDRDEIFVAKEGEKASTKTFNTQKLKDTIKAFEQRKTVLEALRAERPHIIDPSI